MKRGMTIIDDSVKINFPDRMEVHEFKAPTDESVRLLNEMQDRARKNIIAEVIVNDNVVNGCCLMFCEQEFGHTAFIEVKFMFNGQEFKFSDKVSASYFEDFNIQQLNMFAHNILKLKVFKVFERYINTTFVCEIMNQKIGERTMKQILNNIR